MPMETKDMDARDSGVESVIMEMLFLDGKRTRSATF